MQPAMYRLVLKMDRAEVAAGGFVGQNRGNIASCYAAGRVVGSASDEEELDELRVDVGGFAGRNQENGILRFSFSLGTPISRNEEASLGGFVGRNDASDAIIDGYWKREPPVRYAGVGEGDAPEVKGKSLEQLQSPTEYTDIYADWLIDLDNADEDLRRNNWCGRCLELRDAWRSPRAEDRC